MMLPSNIGSRRRPFRAGSLIVLFACGGGGTETRTVPVPVRDPWYEGVPVTPGQDCQGGLEVPTGSCAGFTPDPTDCPPTPTECDPDPTLAEWCQDHLPCREGPGCPTFRELLWFSGWVPSDLPPLGEPYDWGDATTARCWYGSPPQVYDVFRWGSDAEPRRQAWFDAATGEWLALVEYDACCGGQILPERRWGRVPTSFVGCDNEWGPEDWLACAEGSRR